MKEKNKIFIFAFFLFIFNSANSENIYFASDKPPASAKDIPAESPLCYRFNVKSIEKQLEKLKTKYHGQIYDYSITNINGASVLSAKRRGEDGEVINYYYTNNPKLCNEYQKTNLQKEPIFLKNDTLKNENNSLFSQDLNGDEGHIKSDIENSVYRNTGDTKKPSIRLNYNDSENNDNKFLSSVFIYLFLAVLVFLLIYFGIFWHVIFFTLYAIYHLIYNFICISSKGLNLALKGNLFKFKYREKISYSQKPSDEDNRFQKNNSDINKDKRTEVEILGLQPVFTFEELRKAYKEQCQRLHPDKWQDKPDSVRSVMEEELKRVNDAYNKLKIRF